MFYSNLILCHLYTVNIPKSISIAVHKEIVLFIHKGSNDSYHLNSSCCTFASMICLSCTLFCFTLCFISIYLFHNFLCTNKKALSIQSTLHTSANRLIFYTSPVSFVGLKTATTSCKSTRDTALCFGINGLSMILCLWSPLHPLSKLLAIQDHAQNLEEQLWMGERKEVSIISHWHVTKSDLKQERLFFCESVSTFLQLVVWVLHTPIAVVHGY